MPVPIVFHHDAHTHPFLGPLQGVAAGDFTILTSGEDATNVFYRIHLTATDSGVPLGPVGELSSSTFVDVLPNVSQVTLAAEPADVGLQLEFDQRLASAPATWDSVVNFPRSIGAPTPQMVGGAMFVFDSWSDGGAAAHTIATQAVDTTYTATFIQGGFTDDPLVPGVTAIRAVHFMELRARIDVLLTGAFPWTDHPIIPGTTPVRWIHLLEIQTALDQAYADRGAMHLPYTPGGVGVPIVASHITELRQYVVDLEVM